MSDLHNKLRAWTGVGDTGGIQRNRDLMLQASDRIRELERESALTQNMAIRIRELEARELALTKFAEFCDYHHRSCDGLKGQHLDCDCGYTGARDELRAALASQSDRGSEHGT